MAKKREREWNVSGIATAMQNATAPAARVNRCTLLWRVLAALSA